MKEKFDDIDLYILSELKQDSKQPIRALAEKLKIHPNTLIQRIHKLENSKIIRSYSLDIDYGKLGYQMQAIVMIKVRRNLLGADELKTIENIPEVKCLYSVTGSDDCVALITALNHEHFVQILRSIQAQKYVIKTTTHIVIRNYKDQTQFSPFNSLAEEIGKGQNNSHSH